MVKTFIYRQNKPQKKPQVKIKDKLNHHTMTKKKDTIKVSEKKSKLIHINREIKHIAFS